MMRLGDTKAMAGARRQPVAERDLEQILRIPHTASILAKIATLSVGSDREAVDMRPWLEAKRDAEERDELAAERPDGCWCFGRGGSGERAVLVPGNEIPMVLSVYCKCAEAQARRIVDDEARQRAQAFATTTRLQGIWEAAQIPERFTGCTLETFPVTTPKMREIVASLRAWLRSPAWAVVVQGEYGVGKTGLGIGLLRLAAEHQVVGLFVKAPDLLARVRATYGKNADATELEVLESLRTVPLLMLDDIGAEQETDWATSMLFQILDSRHDNARKTIVTTNLDIPALAMHLGERTFHRFEEDAMFQTVQGPNLRREPKGA